MLHRRRRLTSGLRASNSIFVSESTSLSSCDPEGENHNPCDLDSGIFTAGSTLASTSRWRRRRRQTACGSCHDHPRSGATHVRAAAPIGPYEPAIISDSLPSIPENKSCVEIFVIASHGRSLLCAIHVPGLPP